MRPLQNKSIIYLLFVAVGLTLVNYISSSFYYRLDLTKDKRYTISSSTKDLIASIEAPLLIDVFLEGDFTPEFKLLQNEVKSVLEEYQKINPLIKVNYINPLAEESDKERNIKELIGIGMRPYAHEYMSSGQRTSQLIFDYAFARFGDKTTIIDLFDKQIESDLPTDISNAISALEYNFSSAINRITTEKTKSIAILKGNGQLDDFDANSQSRTRYINDFLKALREDYRIAPFTLDSVATNPIKTLNSLKTFDLIISAKPTKSFTEAEKLVLDQYTMSGGKSLWLLENMIMERDSLNNPSGSALTIGRDLNLNDFFFHYGARVNQNLVLDLFSAPIYLKIGDNPQERPVPIRWTYYPMVYGNNDHPISKNTDLIKLKFASQIDTLKNDIQKTVLLKSSTKSKLMNALQTVNLPKIGEEMDENDFNLGEQNLGVLLEGEFKSSYKNRVLPFKLNDYRDKSPSTKMVIISDGDIIKNDVIKNQPLVLGFDYLAGRMFGNKKFLLNTVNYLLDDTGMMQIRSKQVDIAYLDLEKVKDKKVKWQTLNLLIPVVLLGVFGSLFYYIRRKKYS